MSPIPNRSVDGMDVPNCKQHQKFPRSFWINGAKKNGWDDG